MPLTNFYSYEKEYSLLMPRKIRFASNYIMIHELLKMKAKLCQNTIDPRWKKYIEILHEYPKKKF